MSSLSLESAWAEALDVLLPSVHRVDRDATRIWCRFFPWRLAAAIGGAADQAAVVHALRLEGRYRLADQIDTSHWFLYGHRHWAAVKRAALDAPVHDCMAAPELTRAVRDIAHTVAEETHVDESLLVGMSAIALITRQQVGDAACERPATERPSHPPSPRSPDDTCAARERDDSRGFLGVFRGDRQRYSVWFDERRPDGRFRIVNQQHLTTAAAADTRAYTYDRGYSQDGPIPAQCRSGSCGTCWVGVLGGAEKLSEVERLEARRLRECGYLDSTEAQPLIRLACMARASGNVTIVIPPWNGFLAKG